MGKYAEDAAMTSCDSCETGYVIPFEGSHSQRDCQACNPGEYALSDGSRCRKCKNGRFTEQPAASNCTACPEGATTNTNRTMCEPCEGGFYGLYCNSSCPFACQKQGTLKIDRNGDCLRANPSASLKQQWQLVGLGDEYSKYLDLDDDAITRYEETFQTIGATQCVCRLLWFDEDCGQKQNTYVSFIVGIICVGLVTVFLRHFLCRRDHISDQNDVTRNCCPKWTAQCASALGFVLTKEVKLDWGGRFSFARLVSFVGFWFERRVLIYQYKDLVTSELTDRKSTILSLRELEILCAHHMTMTHDQCQLLVRGKVVDSAFAEFSAPVPLAWSSSPEMMVFDADANPDSQKARGKSSDAIHHGNIDIRDKIYLCCARTRNDAISIEQRATAAGAKAAIIVYEQEELFYDLKSAQPFKSTIPVLMIKLSDAAKLREYGRAQIKSGARRDDCGVCMSNATCVTRRNSHVQTKSHFVHVVCVPA